MRRHHLLLVIVAAALAACGVSEARAPERGVATRHRVLLVGDSLMGNTAPLLDAPLTKRVGTSTSSTHTSTAPVCSDRSATRPTH